MGIDGDRYQPKQESTVRKTISIIVPTLCLSVLLAACGSSSSSKQTSSATTSQPASGESSVTVKTARDAALGATILADSGGMTLYHLSGEQNGKFICTSSACIGIWHPLTAPSGSTPSGAESLGTVKRPDGTIQVTYKGTPLYTFAQDSAEGEAKGQGIKDVGTWSAVTVSAGASAPATTTTTSPSSGGGGYAY
jgi:predicted lipoprotein with Yx(FWY)xxD motif